MPRPLRRLLAVWSCVWFLAAPALGATWDVEATLSTEKQTDVVEGSSESTESFEQNYTISYQHDINPVLSINLDFNLDVSDEINEPGFDTRSISPSVDLGLVGVWWDLSASWEFSQDSSHDPAEQKTEQTTWTLEGVAEPATPVVPSVGFSYERNKDVEGGDINTIEESYTVDLQYDFWDIISIDFAAQKDDNLQKDGISVPGADLTADQRDENRQYSFDISFDKDVGENFKVSAEWSNERDQSITKADESLVFQDTVLLRKGAILDREDTLDNSFRAQASYIPLDILDFTVDKSIDWTKDIENGPKERTNTLTSDMALSLPLTETIQFDFDFSDDREWTNGSDADSNSINHDYASSLEFNPLSNISLTASWDRSTNREWFEDKTLPGEESEDISYELDLSTSFWYDQIDFNITRGWNFAWDGNEKTTDDRNLDFDLTITPDNIPNLEFSPKFTYTEDEDKLTNTTDKSRDLEVQITYEVNLDVLSVTLDHTYSRTVDDPAEGQETISRDDDTDLTISWTDFLYGMSVEFSVTRTASDEELDDKGPEIDYQYTFSYDWEILGKYFFSFEFSQDDKDESEDTRNIQTTISTDFLDGRLTLDIEHEYDTKLEGTQEDTHRYFIEVSGKF